MPSWHLDLALPETNIAPETLGLEDEFPFGKASWQVLCWFGGMQFLLGGARNSRDFSFHIHYCSLARQFIIYLWVNLKSSRQQVPQSNPNCLTLLPPQRNNAKGHQQRPHIDPLKRRLCYLLSIPDKYQNDPKRTCSFLWNTVTHSIADGLGLPTSSNTGHWNPSCLDIFKESWGSALHFPWHGHVESSNWELFNVHDTCHTYCKAGRLENLHKAPLKTVVQDTSGTLNAKVQYLERLKNLQ